MRILEQIRFRWDNNRAPLPGEVKPTKNGTKIMYMSEPQEAESSLHLRKLRGLLTGYGEGWTFTAALWDWLRLKLLIGLYIIIVLGYFYLLNH